MKKLLFVCIAFLAFAGGASAETNSAKDLVFYLGTYTRDPMIPAAQCAIDSAELKIVGEDLVLFATLPTVTFGHSIFYKLNGGMAVTQQQDDGPVYNVWHWTVIERIEGGWSVQSWARRSLEAGSLSYDIQLRDGRIEFERDGFCRFIPY